jgi:hypothetical protein
MNPAPGVWIVNSDVASALALTTDKAVREKDPGALPISLEVMALDLA